MPDLEAAFDPTSFKSQLAELARKYKLVGWDKIAHYHHARLVIAMIEAFGDDRRAVFHIETRSGNHSIPRPDLILIHPEVGVLVVEHKGISLTDVQGVNGTDLRLLREGRLKFEDPFHQAEKVAFRLQGLVLKRVERSQVLFLHTAALPRIAQDDFERQFQVRWPAETLFADAFINPMELRTRILAFARDRQCRAGIGCRLSKRAYDAVCLILDGRSFLHSPRKLYIEDAEGGLLGPQIQEMELGLKEPTTQQQQYGAADLRGQHRLFRSVADSGKSIMLALSAAQTLGRHRVESGDLFENSGAAPRRCRVLVVCFNRTLVYYLKQRIEDRYSRLTWEKPSTEALTLLHFERLIKTLENREPQLATGMSYDQKQARAEALCGAFDSLDETTKDALGFDAVYVDEAQDLLPVEISFLLKLAKRDEQGRQTFIVFYDNAQNIYGVTQPVWEQVGLKIGGRTVFLD